MENRWLDPQTLEMLHHEPSRMIGLQEMLL